MDRGMVSTDNLEFLRERGAKYIVGTPKAMSRAFERELAEQNWVAAQEGVDVKLVPLKGGRSPCVTLWSEVIELSRHRSNSAGSRAAKIALNRSWDRIPAERPTICFNS